MDNPITVYITTCDANMFVLKYFQYFFNKYWGKHMKVKILGFNHPDFPLADNFEFISLGTEQIGGASGWSNYLIDYFNNIDDEFILFGIDDFMIARPVDEEAYHTCLALLDNKTGRIDLQCSLQYARNPQHTMPYKTKNGIDFLVMAQSVPGVNLYQNSGAFSIWNRKWFLKNIQNNWSPWDWETKGSSLANNDGFNIAGAVNRWPIRKLELLSNVGWPGVLNVRGIRDEDLDEMKKLRGINDRVRQFEKIMDDKWGYDVLGSKWIDVIYGK